eukprot:jgi/Mesen1/7371/ME000381S06606
MFWRVAGLATTSPVDLILDKEKYTLEELLDEDDLIQECKSLNNRLVNFLRTRPQVESLVRFVVEEPADDADDKRQFKYPFVACEIFTCEIDHIFNTMLENEEILDLLFSFVDVDRPHSNLLAGYFSKVVMCLLVRRTPDIMLYLQGHLELLSRLVDLIGITSIMEVVMKLAGADDQIMLYNPDSVRWLADTNLLNMLVDKLGPQYPSDVHASAAEILSAIARTAPSALASQLSSPDLISKLFRHVLEEGQAKTGVIHSLSVCITLLDPRQAAYAAAASAARGVNQPAQTADPETVDGMLQRIGDLVALLDFSGDENLLPTTYGQLKPPLGMHRLKVIEFVAVLLRTDSEVARRELIRLRAVQIALDLFFRFPFNNMLHHQVESIVDSCLESNSPALLDNLLRECNLVARVLDASAQPNAPDSRPEPRATSTRAPCRNGYMGHLTRIANRMVQLSNNNPLLQAALRGNSRWVEWQTSVLQKRNAVENVYQWSCGRPSALDDRQADSDEEEFVRGDRDFDISTLSLTNNVPRDFHRFGMFDTDDLDEYDVEQGKMGLELSSLQISHNDREDSKDHMRGSPEISARVADSTMDKEAATGTSGAAPSASKMDTGDSWGDSRAWSALQQLQSGKLRGAAGDISLEDDDDEMDTASSPPGTGALPADPSSAPSPPGIRADAGGGGAQSPPPGVLSQPPAPAGAAGLEHMEDGGGGGGSSKSPRMVAEEIDLFANTHFSFAQPPPSSFDPTHQPLDFFGSGKAEAYNSAASPPSSGAVSSSSPVGELDLGPGSDPAITTASATADASAPSAPAPAAPLQEEDAAAVSEHQLDGAQAPDLPAVATLEVPPDESPPSTSADSKEEAASSFPSPASSEEAHHGQDATEEVQPTTGSPPSTPPPPQAEVPSEAAAPPSPSPSQPGDQQNAGGWTATFGGPNAAVHEEAATNHVAAGLEPEGTKKFMEHALREGIVGEALPLHSISANAVGGVGASEGRTVESEDNPTFNDVNFWKSTYEDTVELAGGGEARMVDDAVEKKVLTDVL